MKKVISGIALIAIIAVGAMAYAHGPGRGGGQMMGPEYGMMGPGYGGHMTGPGARGYAPDQKFLEETADIRKDLHNKKFEYFEARRNPETSDETMKKLEKEMYELQTKIREKAPARTYGGYGGYGSCW
jgi:hypothetical protein